MNKNNRAQLYTTPGGEDFYSHFKEMYHRSPRQQEEKVLDYFINNVCDGIENSIENDRFNLVATMVAALSSQESFVTSLNNELLGNNDKRSSLTKTIASISSGNDEFVDNLLNNDQEVSELLEEKRKCNSDEKMDLGNFCRQFTLILANEIYELFDKKELEEWSKTGFKTPEVLLKKFNGKNRKDVELSFGSSNVIEMPIRNINPNPTLSNNNLDRTAQNLIEMLNFGDEKEERSSKQGRY